MALLEVSHLVTHFKTANGVVRAVNDVSFGVQAGETLCLVGESGSGKSVAAMSILQLLDGASHPDGTITFNGTEMLSARESEIRRLRGSEIAMIFQEPLTSLNPVMRVGTQIEEAIRAHEGVSRKAARERAAELLSEVGIPDPARPAGRVPAPVLRRHAAARHDRDGAGLRPKLLIADEPTTALDATIQAQILELLRRMQSEHGMALLFITHDMGVVAQMADRVAVMYAGRIVEQGPVGQVFASPLMPYTWSLLESVPRLDATADRFFSIPGTPPRTSHPTSGCPFQPRCPVAVERCQAEDPPLLPRSRAATRRACCHRRSSAPPGRPASDPRRRRKTCQPMARRAPC